MIWPLVDHEKNIGQEDEVFTSLLLRFLVYERKGGMKRVRLLYLPIWKNY
jgi:hypothetical protein